MKGPYEPTDGAAGVVQFIEAERKVLDFQEESWEQGEWRVVV